jgi:hypothetical protein
MLGPGRYLLGVAEILLLGGFAWLGGTALRAWLLPRFEGAPAHLATAVLALALLIWSAEILGSFSALDPLPLLLLIGAIGIGIWALPAAGGGGRGFSPASWRTRAPSPRQDPRPGAPLIPTLIALLIAAVAVLHFAGGVKTRLSTGMTGFDSTWYHGPFAAGFFQSSGTWDLHFIAPQFLAWFYPANAEIFHTIGMLAFDRDVLSPLLNLGWFIGCLVACWCIGRPYGVAPWSLALGAIALSVPALADQAGEARNDIVGTFFLLTAVAVAANAWGQVAAREGERRGAGGSGAGLGPYLVVGLAAGLAAGTKLNFLLPAAVLVVGLAVLAPPGAKQRVLAAASLASLAGGGYWYLRNLVHAGNPLPWIDNLGPISLPASEQGLGGREAHSVLDYLTDGTVWSDWFLPGFQDGLWFLWPLLLGAAVAGLVLALLGGGAFVNQEETKAPGARAVLALAGLVGLASAVAWLVAPTSASGPEGMPRGFESGLRYLAPAVVLGLALLPTAPAVAKALSRFPAGLPSFASDSGANDGGGRWRRSIAVVGAVVVAIGVGFPVQRHYLESRYSDPSFTAPGLNAAFAWARDISDARIATTSTRQYPLFGTDLSNHVQFIGQDRPHAGFEAPATCQQFRRLVSDGDYDYLIATRDRLEPGKPLYPRSAHWTEGAGAKVILRKPPTVVFELTGNPRPSACR